MPLLTTPANQQGWPDVVAKEVTENLHKFVSSVYVTIGQMKGQTLLPLPPPSTMPTMQPEQKLQDQDRVHILESAIVTWTKQIKNVLKADPDAPLKVSLPVMQADCSCRDVHGQYIDGKHMVQARNV